MAPKSKELPVRLRDQVVKLRKKGSSVREVAAVLSIPKSTVCNIERKFRATGTTDNQRRSGRPRATSRTTDDYIVTSAKKNRRVSAKQLASDLKSTDLASVTPQTVRNRLHEARLYGRSARKRPHISERNRKKRLTFAKMHLSKSSKFWDRILWSDETKINFFNGSDGKINVWRNPKEEFATQCIVPTVKHGGGNVLVWGCMSATGVGDLHFIEQNMDAKLYHHILVRHLQPSARRLIGAKFIFQHDNDPKHTSKLVKSYLAKKRVQVLQWPPQSPDLNPIEHLWAEVKRHLRNFRPSNKEELKAKIEEVWKSISSDVMRKLVGSMSDRCHAVKKAKGMATRY